MQHGGVPVKKTFQSFVEIVQRKRITSVLKQHKTRKSKCPVRKYTRPQFFHQHMQLLQIHLNLPISIDRLMHVLTYLENLSQGLIVVVLLDQFSAFGVVHLPGDEISRLGRIHLGQFSQSLSQRCRFPQISDRIGYGLLGRYLQKTLGRMQVNRPILFVMKRQPGWWMTVLMGIHHLTYSECSAFFIVLCTLSFWFSYSHLEGFGFRSLLF